MKEQLGFLTTFVRHPFSVGAVAPSSRWLARRMVDDMGLDEADTIVELGPGTGAFTGAILERKGRQTEYVALELDTGFAAELGRRYPDIRIVNDSAERIAAHLESIDRKHADSIICGLPWASFPEDLQRRIMSSVVDALPAGGRFATFAYIHAAWFPTARKFRRFLEEHFTNVATTPVVWRNLPPAFVYRCTK